MTENGNAPEPDAGMAEALGKMEDQIKRIEVLRKKQRLASLAGIILLLIVLLVFVYRLYSHFEKSYFQALKDDSQRERFVTQIMSEAGVQRVVEAELEAGMAQLREDVIPELVTQITAEFSNARPDLEAAISTMGQRLNTHTRKYVEQRLVEALAKSLEEVEKELAQIFPDCSVDDIERQLNESKDIRA